MAKKNKKKFVAWKPSKHVGEVIIDDVDAPTNNAKAKKIERYYNSIRYQYDSQPGSWLDKPNLQIQIHLHHVSQLARVVEELSKAQSCRKVELSIHLADDQPKSGKQSEPTIRVCRVRQMADKTLQCSACGRKMPSTPKGEIDKDQLALEMSLRSWTCLR